MKLAHLLPQLRNQLGFTMIELLVVIAVIGVLAVAVLSSINPIEQINKGRDTRTRSDAAQMINAVDRYYAIHEKYPWNVSVSGGYSASSTLPSSQFYMGAVSGTAENAVITTTSGEWNWVDLLSSTSEVKQGFVNRVKKDNKMVIFKASGSNATMYDCFLPSSNAFKQEAMDNCASGTTPGGTGSTETPPNTITTCPNATSLTAANLICLP